MGDDDRKPPPITEEIRQEMISSFTDEIKSSSREFAIHILEAHQWDIAAAFSAFKDAVVAAAASAARPNVPNPSDSRTHQSSNPLGVDIPVSSPSSPRSPSRAEDDFDDKENVDVVESDDVERLRFLSEILSVTPRAVHVTVTIWRNGVILGDDNTLHPLDVPENAKSLEAIERLDSPRNVDSPGGTRRVVFKLIRRQEEDFPGPFQPFQGVGRTLAKTDSVPPAPTTSIKVILADGTPIVSRFTTTHHTIRDVRDFIDASTPDASRDYHLLNMGTIHHIPLTDLDHTIEQAGISNSVLAQKLI